MEQISQLRLDQLHESPFNPRKIFDETALQELATDIKATGRVLQPLLVRPRIPPLSALLADAADATLGHEVVFGHRRLRAAQLAGLDVVPCMIRTMSDDEAMRAQISENLQRTDVHPIEEAEGFQALIEHHGEGADRIAEQTGKSRSYVYGRLKLLEACPEIRRACLAGEIGSEAALLVARLRTVKLQEKALAYIKADYRAKLDDGGKQSHRTIQALLAEKFTLDLKTAMFDVEDEMLLPLAGNCVTCPKRSSNAPEYQDLVEGSTDRWGNSHAGRPNVCTDPECFDAKKKAHLAREAAKLTEAGKLLVTGNAARASISAQGEIKGAYIALKDVQGELKKLPRKGVEGDANQPTVVLIQDPRTGKTHKAVKREDLKAAGVKLADAPKKSGGCDYEAENRRRAEENAQAQVKVDAERALRMTMLNQIRNASVGRDRSEFDLRLIARAALAGVDYDDKKVLADLWPGVQNNEEHRAKLIDGLDLPELAQFMLDCALVRNAMPQWTHDLHKLPQTLQSAAQHYGIDLAAIRADAKTASTPPTAARAPKDGKAKAGAKKPAAPAKPKKIAAAAAKEQTDDAGGAGGSGAQADASAEAMA